MGLVTLWRTVANTDMGFRDIAIPLMVMGFALPFFFIPTTGLADSDASVRTPLEQAGMAADAVNQAIDYLITSQAVMLATNQLMTVIGIAFLVAASVIWLVPKPTRVVEPGAGGH